LNPLGGKRIYMYSSCLSGIVPVFYELMDKISPVFPLNQFPHLFSLTWWCVWADGQNISSLSTKSTPSPLLTNLVMCVMWWTECVRAFV
jgi:hypothetical protein